MVDYLVDNKRIYDLEWNFIHVFSFLMKFIVVLFLFGVIQDKPIYFLEINFVIKILISLFLMYRFNKYRTDKIRFTELDRKVTFSAGSYILILSFADLLNGYIEKIRAFIIPYSEPIIQKGKNLVFGKKEYAI